MTKPTDTLVAFDKMNIKRAVTKIDNKQILNCKSVYTLYFFCFLNFCIRSIVMKIYL